MVLALGRSEPLKNFPLTMDVVARAGAAAAGAVPVRSRARARRRTKRACATSTRPSDEEVNELFNRATAFVQTSTHEGFCLPVLESMATGGAVVCTDAHGNRDFCVDGENCLMVDPEPEAVAAGLRACSATRTLRARLGAAGIADRAALRLAGADRRAARRSWRTSARPRENLPARLQILRDPRRGPVEHPEAEHEGRPPRSRSVSAGGLRRR